MKNICAACGEQVDTTYRIDNIEMCISCANQMLEAMKERNKRLYYEVIHIAARTFVTMYGLKENIDSIIREKAEALLMVVAPEVVETYSRHASQNDSPLDSLEADLHDTVDEIRADKKFQRDMEDYGPEVGSDY